MFWPWRKRPSDKRRHGRVPFPGARAQVVIKSMRDGRTVQPRVLDISVGGLRFRGDSRRGRLYKGDEVAIEMLPSLGDLPIHLSGQVVWFQVVEGGLQYEGGIQFGPMEPEVRSCLEGFIKRAGVPRVEVPTHHHVI